MSESLKEQQNFSKVTDLPLPAKWVDEIFLQFHGRFGNDFARKWQTGVNDSNGLDLGIENGKRIWGIQLSGFTPEEIKRGLNSEYKYLPSCDDFKSKCRPSIDYERAYVEACQQMHARKEGNDKWSDPAVFWAAKKLGSDLTNNPYNSIKSRWAAALDDAREKLKVGELPHEIPKRKIELPPPGRTTVSKEESERRFAKIHEILDKKVSSNTAEA